MTNEFATAQSEATAFTDVVDLIGLTSSGGWIRLPIELLQPSKLEVVPRTSNYTLTTADSGKVFTNFGASATVTLSLPDAVPGLHYRALCRATQALRLDPVGSHVIANNTVNGTAGGAGKYIGCDTSSVGACIHLMCSEAGRWDILSSRGTWTLEA